MKKSDKLYRYWILAACFVCLCIFSGVGMYAFGLFFKPVIYDFGWSRTAISLAFTMLYFVQGLFQPVTGRLTDHFGPRRIIVVGALITGLGFLLLSSTATLWHYYLFFGVVGIGLATLGLVPISTLISNWFMERRGTALGVATTGIGVGGIILPPLIGTWLIPTFGWGPSFGIIALLIWIIVIPVTLLVIRDRPVTDPLPQAASVTQAEELTGPLRSNQYDWTVKRAIKTSAFWLIVTGFMLTNLTSIGIFQHQVNHFTDIGFSTAVAATSLSLVGFGSTVGKISFGFFSDHLKPRYCAAVSFAFQAVSIVVLLYTKSEALVWLYAILIGIGMGGWAPLIPQLISVNFGTFSFGTILGIMRLIKNTGMILGPLLAGYAFDTMHTYQWIFIIFLGLYALAIPSILTVRRPAPPSEGN